MDLTLSLAQSLHKGMDNCLNEAPGFSPPSDWLLSVGESFIDKIGWEPGPGNVNQRAFVREGPTQ